MVSALRRPAAACLLAPMLAIAAAARAGEARCWIDHGAVVVAAAYGPIAGDFILDLSQAHSQLHATPARAAGWTQDQARWTLRVAGRTSRGFPMEIADLDARSAGFPTNIAGVLGADVLGPSALELDLDPCRLRLTGGRGVRRTGPEPLKIRMIDGVPAVFAGVSDGVTSRTGWFAIDSASAGSRIAEARLSRPPRPGVDPGDRARPPARLRAVSVGDALVEQTPAGVMVDAPPGLAGALGLAIWQKVRLRVGTRGGSAGARPRSRAPRAL